METNNISEEQPTVEAQPSINAQDATAKNTGPTDYKVEAEKWEARAK